MKTQVASFYQFLRVHDLASLRDRLQTGCAAWGLAGSILLSPEGINGTLAGDAAGIEQFILMLRTGADGVPAFTGLELKYSTAGERHFDRLKVKIKREIITFNAAAADPLQFMGEKVPPAGWNALLDDPDVVVLDTRNQFEVEMGSFAGAVDPGLKKFSDFRGFVDDHLAGQRDKKIAMFCTGGIRCEKASAYMLAAGFSQVFMLRGGILKYLEEIPPAESRWRGDCFVFDQRVALRHGLEIATELEGYAP